MSQVVLYSLASVLIVSLISLVGVFAIVLSSKFGRKILTFLVSFSAGALLGDVFIHLLPDLAEEGKFTFEISLYILGTIVAFFVMEKYIHWHHHHDEGEEHKNTHPLVFTNLIGDGIHNFIDGLVIGSTYLLDIKLGIATTIAVALHEIPQEFGDFGVLLYGGLSKGKALFFNFLSALTAVAGTLLALKLRETENLTNILLALGTGSFIYIATADLIPQIHKEREKEFTQLLSFALGIATMFVLLFLE